MVENKALNTQCKDEKLGKKKKGLEKLLQPKKYFIFIPLTILM
jgi:hypothetical protein